MIASRPLTMVDAERPLVLVIEDDSDLRQHLSRHARGARVPGPGGGLRRRGASRLRREAAGRGPARPEAPRRDGTRRAARAAAALPGDPGGGGLGLRQRAGRGGGDAARRLGVPGEAGREGAPLRRPRPGARARAAPRRASRRSGRRTAPGTGWWGAPRPCSASTSSWTWWLPRGRA